MLFGLLFPYVHPEDTILDLGIGTGLGSIPFHQAGLDVIGLANSSAMPAACDDKGFTTELIKHDVTRVPWPLGPGQIDLIIAVGVLHFGTCVHGILAETARILPPGGRFGFDYHQITSDETGGYELVEEGVYTHIDPGWNVRTVRHTADYIQHALSQVRLTILPDITWAASKDQPMFFRTVTAQLQT